MNPALFVAMLGIAPVAVAPDAATIAVTSTSPTVSVAYVVAPANAAISLAASSPATAVVYNVTPAAAVIALSATSPTVGVGYAATPANAAIALAASQPTVMAGNSITPAPATLALASTSPTVAVAYSVAPASAAIVLAATSPIVTVNYAVAPSSATIALTATSPAPVVVADHAPITVTQAKAFLKVDTTDDDALIGDLIDAAADYFEASHGIVCAARTATFTFDTFDVRLPILRNPVRAITGVSYTDVTGTVQTLAPTQWQVRKHNGVQTVQPALNVAWPTPEAIDGAVTVTADIGWTTNAQVPATVRLAAQKLVTAWYQVRDAADPPADVDRMLYAYRPGTL
jgi:uncharacterized phiE125 gp8 family phage protein